MPGASRSTQPMNATAGPGLDFVIGRKKSTHMPVLMVRSVVWLTAQLR